HQATYMMTNSRPTLLFRWPHLSPEHSGWSARMSFCIPLVISLALAGSIMFDLARRSMRRMTKWSLQPAKWTAAVLCVLILSAWVAWACRIGWGGASSSPQSAAPSAVDRLLTARAVVRVWLPVEHDGTGTVA